MALHVHPSLGIDYEAVAVDDHGPDPDHPGLRAVAIVVAYQVRGNRDTHLLDLKRSMTPAKLAELREGLPCAGSVE